MANDVLAEAAALRKKLARLKPKVLAKLRRDRKSAQRVVDDLDRQIAAITGKRDIQQGKRKRTSPTEMRSRIVGELRKHSKDGLSQKQIADDAGLNYVSTAMFIRRNPQLFRSTGKRKQKRYFLKSV